MGDGLKRAVAAANATGRPQTAQHGTSDPVGHPVDSPAPDRAATGRTGHWTGTEEAQANYLIASMTGRDPADVKEPLSRLLHDLRYRADEPLIPNLEGVSLEQVKAGNNVLAGKQVWIWSGEHHAWWRENRCGYVDEIRGAGVYDFAEAFRATSHCGPEKKIRYIPADR